MNNGRDIPSDLITLVCYNLDFSFPKALNYLCGILELEYYYDEEEDIPESLKITRMILEMNQGIDNLHEEKPLKPIPEIILSYYKPYVNDMFAHDGISYSTQREFEIGYDPLTNYITIPIRDEIENLVGVKGRLFKDKIEDDELKYYYLEPCGRSKILYGMYKTYPFIKSKGKCIITEAEKGVMQLWDTGYCNCVGIGGLGGNNGGKKISSHQVEKLTRLGVDLIFAFDKDVTKQEIEENANRFVEGVNIYYIFDEQNILKDKESPMDNPQNFKYLYENCLFKIR